MKVNMTPNPLDVVTIHASQGDTEARQWEFELHNNGELIDTSDVKEQLVFKAYKGGTEQLLPENGSTPTTSPFNGDIKYPQGLLTDQEFLYRESPAIQNGLARIDKIKGNTLVWNQFGEITKPTATINDVTFTNNNNQSISVSGTASANSYFYLKGFSSQRFNVGKGKILLKGCPSGGDISTFRIALRTYINGSATWYNDTGNGVIFDCDEYIDNVSVFIGNGITISNLNFVLQIFNLTQMGLDSITDPSEFTSLFSLPYYDFNAGTMLSFNGNGIKTVSKNQFDTSAVTTSYQGLTLTKTPGTIRANYSGGSQYAGFNFYGSPVFTDTFLKGKYRLSFDVSGLDTQWTVGLRQGASFLGGGQALAISNDGHYSFTIDAEANPNCYLSFARTGNKTTAYDVTFSNIQLELGTTETSYTQYEEKTISLPISQYFPWGMDGVGTAYDKLTNSGYVKRMSQVDLGTLNWTYGSSRFQSTDLNGLIATNGDTVYPNIKCAKYPVFTPNQTSTTTFGITAFNNHGTMYLRVLDSNYTSASAFKTAMQGVILKYELNTPLENYGVVDLGTLTYTIDSGNTLYASVTGLKGVGQSEMPNILCPIFTPIKYSDRGSVSYPNISITSDLNIRFGRTGYTDVTAFKQAMQGVYLLYEKENPQGFTTASLVTENAEIPLSNEDGTLIGKCTEELSAEPGFHDAKIKLSDSDGTCYSNKLQLHVERSPQ